MLLGSIMQALKDPTSEAYREARRRHWDAVAVEGRPETGMRGCYHRHLAKVYDFLIGPGARVLEIGCAEGNLLAALNPSFGVGVDFSPAMLSLVTRNSILSRLTPTALSRTLPRNYLIRLLTPLFCPIWPTTSGMSWSSSAA